MRTMEFNEKKYITNNEDGIYGVDLCPISNTIRFTAKCDGIIYAYVVVILIIGKNQININ